MIKFTDIHKSFGKLQVLKGVSFDIQKGQCMAILGPNGSGKSTLIKSILGLVIPDKGEIFIDEKNIIGQSDYRNEIGYLPQITKLPENISVIELLKMIQDIRKTTGNIDELVTYFGIANYLNKTLKTLSGGTRQKVNVILSLMFNASLFIFDEPTVGLDPISCVKFKQRVLQEKQNGKTVILTTHILSEVEELADQIVFIMDGQIYYHGSPDQLKNNYQENTLEKAIAKMLETYK